MNNLVLLGLYFILIVSLYKIIKNLLNRSILYNKYIDIIIELPGTVIHELSHLIVSIICLSKIKSVSIIPKIEGDRITYGHVEYIAKLKINSFFISIGPLILNIPIMMLIIYYFNIEINYFLLEKEYLTIENVFKSYIFMIIITSSILSREDIKVGIDGLISISGVVFLGIISYIGYYQKIDEIIIKYIKEISDKKIIFEINEIMLNVIMLMIGVIMMLLLMNLIFNKIFQRKKN